jgi:hypothetical protein
LTVSNGETVYKITRAITLDTVHLEFFTNVSETGSVSIITCKKGIVPTPLGPSKRATCNQWTPQGLGREYILLTLKFNSRDIFSAQNSFQCPMIDSGSL